MNILLINHYAGSIEMGMEFRPYYFAKEWVSQGHNVSIIAASYSHLRTKNPKVKKNWEKEKIDGINYYWVKTNSYSGNGIGRLYNIMQFLIKTIISASKLCKTIRPDVVISSSTYPMDGYISTKIRRISGAKYIHEVHDMWPISLIELNGMSKLHPFIIMNQIAEDRFCKKADVVLSIPACTKQYFVKHGMKPEKFCHIPNGIVVDDWENPSLLPKLHQEILDELRKKEKFIICFTGSHNEMYGLKYLIEAVRKCERNDVVALFVGSGYLKDKLIDETKNERDKFIFLNPISKLSIPTLLSQVDAVYVSGTKDNIFKYGISMNKLTDAMMAGKPILYAVNAPNNYVVDYNCGISVPPRNSSAIAIAILKMLLMTKEERIGMGSNGHRAALAEFDYKILAQRFLDICK